MCFAVVNSMKIILLSHVLWDINRIEKFINSDPACKRIDIYYPKASLDLKLYALFEGFLSRKPDNLFDPLYFYLSEDFDLGLKANYAGSLVLYNPKAIAYHYCHKVADTFTSAKIDYLVYRNSLYTILKNFSIESILEITGIENEYSYVNI